MTRTSNARIAGFTFLFYIVAGLLSVGMYSRAVGADGATVDIPRIARHIGELEISILFSLLCSLSAVTLAVTLYSLTRDIDRDLARMVLVLRLGEGVLGAASLTTMLGLLRLANAGSGGGAFDLETANQFGAFLVMSESPVGVGSIFFAWASTIFSYLLMVGRVVPMPLARLGVLASVLLVLALPLRLTGLIHGDALNLLWLPMLAFEAPLAVWLLYTGAAPSTPR